MQPSRRYVFRAIVLAAASGTIACSNGTTAPVQPTEVGTYQLVRVNGLALPAPFPAGGIGITATNGTLTLTDTKQWTANVAVLVAAGEVSVAANETMSGTYTRSADTVFLRDARSGAVAPATLVGSTLTVRDEDTLYEFSRR